MKTQTREPLGPSGSRVEELQGLERRLGYYFREPRWLRQALVHSSYACECPQAGDSNERLEFLGDAVLGLVMSDLLLARFPEAREGLLSRQRAALVNARVLAGLAKMLELGEYLRLGKGEEQQAGRSKPKVLANTLEAVIAAVYLDGGLAAARELIETLFAGKLAAAGKGGVWGDYKTMLQEYTQMHFQAMPEYRVVGEEGPAHARLFELEVWLGERPLARGTGVSKKAAAQEAAERALRFLEEAGGVQEGDTGLPATNKNM